MPFIRKIWRHPFQSFCLIHREILHYICPNCNFIVKYWRSKNLFRCYNCNFDLREADSVQVEKTINLQTDFQKYWRILPDNEQKLDEMFRDFYWAVIMAKDKRYGRKQLKNLSLESFIQLFDKAVQRIQNNAPTYECFNCNTIITSWKSYRSHRCEPIIQCASCTKKFKNKSKLKRHTTAVHIKEKNFFCVTCRKGFSTFDGISRHISCHEKDKKRVVCEICKKSFASKDILSNHKTNYHYPKKYSCT